MLCEGGQRNRQPRLRQRKYRKCLDLDTEKEEVGESLDLDWGFPRKASGCYYPVSVFSCVTW